MAVRDEHRIIVTHRLNDRVVAVGEEIAISLERVLQLAPLGPETAIEVAAAVERSPNRAQRDGVRPFVVPAFEDAVAESIA